MIFTICRNFAGDDRIVSILTDNTIDEITTPGYFLQDEIVANIASINNGTFQWGENDIVFVYQPTQFLGLFTYDSTNACLIGAVQSESLAHNNIWIGNASNLPVAAPMTGDVSLALSGSNAVSSISTNFYDFSQFVPSITFATPGDLTVVYGGIRSGKVLKIGKYRKVSVNIEFTPTYTTAAGVFFITGFPDATNYDFGGYIAGMGTSANLVFPVGATQIITRCEGAGTRGHLVGIGTSFSETDLTVTNFGSGQIQLLQAVFEYMVA